MFRRSTIVAGLLVALAAASVLAVVRPCAATAAIPVPPALDPPAQPTTPLGSSRPGLAPSVPEAPRALDADALAERCDACHLAAQSTGTLPPGALGLRAEVREDGVVLRVTAEDAADRETLWRAMLARGALLEALRRGAPVELCAECRARHDALASVHIDVRRVDDGVILVYTSDQPEVVRRILAIARDAAAHSVRF